jgi:hypothetical protein
VPECIACGGPVPAEPFAAALPGRAQALRDEAARLTAEAARLTEEARRVDADVADLAERGEYPKVCTGHPQVPGSGCYRFVMDLDLRRLWPSGRFDLPASDPVAVEAVEAMRAHIDRNKGLGRARGGTGRVLAH